MPAAKHWTVDIYLSEDETGPTTVTHAEARLHTRDATDLHGHGLARKHPGDADVPEIGDELAVARALSNLVHQLLQAAADNMEDITRQPVINLAE
jgi:hypothetical protein